MAKIFVVEDNEGLRDTISSYLEIAGHTVTGFSRLAGLADATRMQLPDLIILDVMLPDGDSFIWTKKWQANNSQAEKNIPIVFLTARTSESDRITGFEIGADDYITKPFSNKELMLRVAAILKRKYHASNANDTTACINRCLQNQDSISNLTIYVDDHRCILDDQELSLTAAEWKILYYLTENNGSVISRDRLLGVCLDYISDGSERTIDTHIKNIRIKMHRQPWIETVRGFGYRFAGKEAIQ